LGEELLVTDDELTALINQAPASGADTDALESYVTTVRGRVAGTALDRSLATRLAEALEPVQRGFHGPATLARKTAETRYKATLAFLRRERDG
jgi:hypothetical protein